MRKREWLIAAAGLLTGVLLLLAWLSPRVESGLREEQALPAWGPIVVKLNRPVRPETVAGRFELSPAVEGKLQVQGEEILFQPAERLDYGQTYTATLRAGASGTNRLPMLWGTEWTFEVRPPRLLFLRQEEDTADLWLVDDDGSERQLTSEPAGVWDFSPLPDGRGLVYSAFDQDGTLDLVQLAADGQRDMLLDCEETLCRSPAGQPFGRWLAYERQALDGDLMNSELWLLDMVSGETAPVPAPEELVASGFATPVGRFPRWSPDGRYLAFYRPDANMVVIQEFAGENNGPSASPAETLTLPANLEAMGGWSPDGRRLVYSELAFGETEPHEHEDESGTVISHTRPSLYNHVVVADVEGRSASDLSAGLEVDEGRPAWHPSGEFLAVARTSTGAGRQLYLVFADGDEARQLTDDPFYNHTALAWSPDGRALAFMRIPRADGSSEPTVMLYDMETGAITPVADGGFLPGWWP